MRILLTNDDGYSAYGINALARVLCKQHDVTVIAPIKCNSGKAHAMTFGKPIYLKKIAVDADYDCFSVSGTPSDCVKLGVELAGNNCPDLVISGINTEPNIGTTVVYSGTCAAAMEASILGIKAIAVSANPEVDADYDYVAEFFKGNLDYYLSLTSSDYALNVNINNPRIGNKEHVLTKIGKRAFSDIYLVGDVDEHGIPHTLVGNPIFSENDPDCDVEWYEKGYPTITPITSDHTSHAVLQSLKKRDL